MKDNINPVVAKHNEALGPLRLALWELVEEMEANIKENGSYSVSATDMVDDLRKALGKVEQKPTAPASFQDYDAGLLSDYGGGNVAWWMDYIRGELERCNEHWREQLSAHQTEKPTADNGLIAELKRLCANLTPTTDEFSSRIIEIKAVAKYEVAEQICAIISRHDGKEKSK
jgi:hypothetical protein